MTISIFHRNEGGSTKMMDSSPKAAAVSGFEDPSNHTAVTTSSDDDDTEAHHVVKETYFHTSRMRDSVSVQKRHGTVNDCEVHEENPHLEDFMVKNHSFHIAGMSMEEAAAKIEAANAAAKAARIAEAAAAAADADDADTAARNAVAAVTSPSRGCLRPETNSYYDRPKTEKSKRKIQFDQVVVRDYEMILGEHPCVGYGPPVTIDWDYVEYNPLPVDEYEFHRPPRRNLRQMGMNYYTRKHLCELAGATEAEMKAVKKEVNKWKTNRYITRQVASYPAIKLYATLESALRKCRRLMKEDHWKSERHLFL
jgi:cell pole-organizing protein PopZ